VRFNGAVPDRAGARVFRVVSRLGTGYSWYSLMLALLATGGSSSIGRSGAWPEPVSCAPWSTSGSIEDFAPPPVFRRECRRAGADPLEPVHFPSGHTLHAVAFSVSRSPSIPCSRANSVPFTAPVAISRVVLGLHYRARACRRGLGALIAQPFLVL